jgi:hypothetical protein
MAVLLLLSATSIAVSAAGTMDIAVYPRPLNCSMPAGVHAALRLLGARQLQLYCLLHETVRRHAEFCCEHSTAAVGRMAGSTADYGPPSGLPTGRIITKTAEQQQKC